VFRFLTAGESHGRALTAFIEFTIQHVEIELKNLSENHG